MASGLLRLMGALGRNVIVANTFGSFALLTVFVMGGFILSKGESFYSISLSLLFCFFFFNFFFSFLINELKSSYPFHKYMVLCIQMT